MRGNNVSYLLNDFNAFLVTPDVVPYDHLGTILKKGLDK